MAFAVFFLAVWAGAAAPARQAAAPPAPPCGACITLEAAPAQARLILRSGLRLDGLEVLVRLDDRPPGEVAALLQALAAAGARSGIVASTGAGLTGEVLAHAETILLDASRPPLDADRAFTLKSLSADLRGAGVSRLGLTLPAGPGDDAVSKSLAPYFDFVVEPAPTGPRERLASPERWTTWPRGRRLDVRTLLGLPAVMHAARVLVELREGDEDLAPLLAALATAVPGGLTPLPDVRVACRSACDAQVYLDPSTLEAVAIVEPRGEVSSVSISPAAEQFTALLPEFAVHVGYPDAGAPWRLVSRAATMAMPRVTQPFVLRIEGWRARSQQAFATGVDVRGQRTMSVEEVIARHQAARARQDRLLHALISAGTTVLTFDAPGFSAPITVTAETTIYTSGASTEIEQHEIRVNGLLLGTKGDEVPKLPLIEPARVSAPPLVITLNEQYRYRLEGVEPLRGRPAFRVRFEPVASNRSMLSGRAWIDAASFGLVRLDSTQTALPGPVVTSRQVDDFEPVDEAGQILWLPARSEIDQRYETASYVTPIHRVVTLAAHRVNPADFAEGLAAAYRSDAVMLRDTPSGLRYLRRPRVPVAAGAAGSGHTAASATRVVEDDRAERVRTVAGGVMWDPNITVPLVFGGLSYLDFDLFGTGAQVDGFFGGTYGRIAWSGPPMDRSGWRASGDAFGIAFSFNERVFRRGVEQYAENVTQRPFHASAGIVGPLAGAWRLRVAYEMDYARYGRADSTAPTFVVPPSTPVHGLRVTLERQRGPWVLSGWWNAALRQRWAAWGFPGQDDAVRRAFQRFGLRASRSIVWSPRAVGRLEASWMDGRDLDRFSRYAFGTFDNPLRGYPSASVRYDRGLVVRSSASWTASSRLRVDAFADLGFVRDPGRSRRARTFPGIGAGLEAPAPFGLLTAVEWGYGIEGINTSGRKGTHVVRASVYKVF